MIRGLKQTTQKLVLLCLSGYQNSLYHKREGLEQFPTVAVRAG